MSTYIKRITISLLSGLLVCAVAMSAHGAGFQLNFSRPANTDPTGFWLNGGGNFYEGSCAAGVSCSGGDGTAFSQEVVNISGVNYWRNVVGDPSDGFAMEYYTRMGLDTSVSGALPFGVDAGGHETATNGLICPTNMIQSSGNSCGNAQDPLNVSHDSTLSGTGTQSPDRMVFRMVISGSGVDMEVYKPFLETKPRITQTVSDATIRSVFVADMRGISFSDKNTPIPIVNTQVIDDPNLPETGSADFSMNMSDQTRVSAGRFTFTDGAGWNSATGWSATGSWFDRGTYDYWEGNGFDAYSFDWSSVFDYSQNSTECNTGSRNNADCPGRP